MADKMTLTFVIKETPTSSSMATSKQPDTLMGSKN